MEALTPSLDRIQHAASQVLRAIEAGPLGLVEPLEALLELLHDAAYSG